MSRNGSGAYSLPAGNPVVTGTTISSTVHNNTLSDIATALTQSLAKDGQTTPTANLPMGGYKHTGVATASSLTDYARADQVQDSAFSWLSSVTGTDTITASISPTPAAYAAGQTFRFISAGANTGAATLNVSSLGAKSIKKRGTTALEAGDIPNGAVVTVTYDGTNFQLNAPDDALVAGDIGSTVQAYDVDTAKLDVDQSWSGSQRATPVTDNDGSFDMNAANDFLCTPTGTITLVFTNYVQGQRGCIYINNTSNYTVGLTASRLLGPSTAATTLSATGKYWISYWCVDATSSAEVVLISVSPALS